MTPTRRTAATGLMSLILLSTAPLSVAQAETGKLVPATKVFSFLEAFLKVPAAERTRLKVTYALRQGGKPAPGVKAVLVEASGARTPLPMDGEGRFERTPTLAQLQAKAQVAFDVPAGAKFGVAMQLDPVLKPSTDYDALELVATVDESNAAIRKAAGAMAMMAPQMEGLTFLKAESGVAVFPNGSTKPLPASAGTVIFEPGALKGATRVRLSKTPAVIDYYDKKK